MFYRRHSFEHRHAAGALDVTGEAVQDLAAKMRMYLALQ
jgi:hypothetical protein